MRISEVEGWHNVFPTVLSFPLDEVTNPTVKQDLFIGVGPLTGTPRLEMAHYSA